MAGSWNRIPNLKATQEITLNSASLSSLAGMPKPWLAYGNGRSYGDVCQNDKGTLIHTRELNQFIAFNREKGILRCAAGVRLCDINHLILPQGWFLPTTPGTALITVGGAVANDVHGKNHHVAGSFGHHVRCFELLRSDGSRLICSAKEHTDLFRASIGGLGLTGLITWVEIALIPVQNPLMVAEQQRFVNIDEYWALNAALQPMWPYSVAWIDCLAKGRQLGRGVMFVGKHAAAQDRPFIGNKSAVSIPFAMPFSLVNSLTVRGFNQAYFSLHRKHKVHLTDYRAFFYPLDTIYHWNRIYGKKGFYQYQCVIPPLHEREGIRAILDAIQSSRQGSFLAVLKTFGNMSAPGLLSFPRAGTTLALDFPEKGRATAELFMELDRIVISTGGALYPAKDARMPSAIFRQSFPQWEMMSQWIDPAFSSHFWQRMQE